MSVTSYKVGGVDLSDILNTENQSYYGDITTNYNQSGTDIGTVFSLQTFSPAPLSITSSNYTAEINQYNTGLNWTGATFVSGGGPATGDWKAVSMSSTGQFGVACIDGGNIYYSSNFGVTWTLSTSSPVVDWVSLSISSDGTKAIAGDYTTTTGQIYYSSDSGVTWTLSTSSVPGKWISVSISSSGQYAVGCIFSLSGVGESIYYSSNSGVTWTIASGTINLAWEGISISSSGQYAIACAANDSIYYSSDYGHTWTASNSPSTSVSWRGVSISSSGQYGIACNNSANTIYWSDDYGVTWNLASTVSYDWERISISSTGQYGIVCPDSGQIYYSFDYGKTWVQSLLSVSSGTGVSISSNGQHALACSSGGGGQIYYSSNMSTTYANQDLTTVFEPLYKYNTWSVIPGQPFITPAFWRGISTSSTGQYVIACSNGTSLNRLYYSNNYGVNWTLVLNQNTHFWSDVSISTSGQYVVACSTLSNEVITYSTNYGANWTPAAVATVPWGPISSSGNGIYVIAGVYNGGHIYYSSNFGANFTVSTSSAIASWASLALSSNGDYAIACSSTNLGLTGQIYYSTNKGVVWTASNFSTGGPAAGNWKSVSISSNGGHSIAASSSDIYYSNGGGTFWTQSYSVTPPLSSGTTWTDIAISYTGQYAVACTNNGPIYYSSDYGNKWVIATGSPIGNWWAITISGNGQYAFGTDDLGAQQIYKCLATN